MFMCLQYFDLLRQVKKLQIADTDIFLWKPDSTSLCLTANKLLSRAFFQQKFLVDKLTSTFEIVCATHNLPTIKLVLESGLNRAWRGSVRRVTDPPNIKNTFYGGRCFVEILLNYLVIRLHGLYVVPTIIYCKRLRML